MRIFSCAAVAAIFPGVVLCANPTLAAVYRCVGAGGTVSYQQIPCSSESRPLNIRDRPSGWSALRPGERALLKSYRDSEGERRRKPQTVRRVRWNHEYLCLKSKSGQAGAPAVNLPGKPCLGYRSSESLA